MEVMQKQWVRFMDDIQKSQQLVSQLSKLYIVLHQNVRKTILKCTIDLNYDPTLDAQAHLTKILDLLKHLNDPNDAYLKGVDPNMISKYQQQLIDLSQQVQKLLQTQRTAKNNDPKQLERIKHVNNKQKYGLKDELKQSQQRILRSKSGRRAHKSELSNRNQHDLFEQFETYKKEYLMKKSKLQKQMEGHIQKRNNQIIFKNKYSGTNLQTYFKLRKDLLDLVLAQQHTQSIINHPLQSQIGKEHILQSEAIQQKLFTQFKIKTKFMKSKVKENILNALADVKIKLLHQYHLSNVKKLTQGNPDTLISLVHEKRRKNASEKALKANAMTSTQRLNSYEPKSKSIKKYQPRASVTRYPMAMKTMRPLVYQSQWTQQIQNKHRKTLQDKLFQFRVPNTARK